MDVIPAVLATNIIGAAIVGFACLLHDKGMVEVDIVVLEEVPGRLQGGEIRVWGCCPSLDLAWGMAAIVVFPIHRIWWIDPVVVGAAKAHRTFKDVTTSDSMREEVKEKGEKKQKRNKRRHFEEEKCVDLG